MLRQRLLTRSFPLARFAADGLVLIFALVLLWGGAMLVALALKASPDTINGLSGYRTANDYLAGLESRDVTSSTRLITAIAGLGAFVLFGCLAWRAVPRPYLVRTDLRMAQDARGSVDVNAHVIERAAEIAVLAHPVISGARARYGTEDLTLDVIASRADELDATLRDVHKRARDSLARHELPPLPVNIILVRLERETRRGLQ